jgi:hypothetical protein
MAALEDIERRRKKARSTYRDVKKHFVRSEGWLPIFRRYARLRNGNVRYLTLCAKEAIDVRYFRMKGVLPYDIKQKAYPTVTFVERDTQDYAIIAETLGTTRLGIKGDLESILVKPDENADNSQKLRNSFPYDIINLDFTGEVIRENDPPYSQTMQAIERIVELQHQSGSTGWHMFLTFRACPQTANHEADQQIRGIIEANFRNAGAVDAYGARPALHELIQDQYEEFLRIGIMKFLAGCAPPRGYEFLPGGSYTYRRAPGDGDPAYHIVKLIVEFRPIRPPRNIPDPRLAIAAYENSVPRIFRSQAIDVVIRLDDAATLHRINRDLRPVLDELERLKIVE